jgi:hypothetical protein
MLLRNLLKLSNLTNNIKKIKRRDIIVEAFNVIYYSNIILRVTYFNENT